MRITAIHDLAVPIRSEIRNAFIDFSQMTASIVGIQSDLMRDGKPLIGYGFNSNGRYSQSGPSCATASSRACSTRSRKRCWTRPARTSTPP